MILVVDCQLQSCELKNTNNAFNSTTQNSTIHNYFWLGNHDCNYIYLAFG